ncbi:radical SAM protein [Desulfofalx alkaliphila]|uniref:radical SAM protein n=1 Tax=Desulfofalx alkaliphila TaxID=105483 RepID=UPI0004E1FB28|nr:radical SAM protein [Desulfofalx alkaliphila]
MSLMSRIFSLVSWSLDWMQVEVSTYCDASCVYCPRTVYSDAWINRQMQLDTYKKLLPVFKKTKQIYLQGWGEPFLNPDFFEMVRLAKQMDCYVGTTTNGMLIDELKARKIVSSGLDLITIPLASTDEKNDTIRVGTNIEQILNNIQLINKAKEKAGSAYPKINIAYMLLASHLESAKDLPKLLKGLGVNEVEIQTLDFVPTPLLEEESLLLCEGSSVAKYLDAMVKQAGETGIGIHYRKRNVSGQFNWCTENIQRALYISSSGDVSPCVFSNIPLKHDKALAYAYQPLTFGNVRDDKLLDIWCQKDYARFRRTFEVGQLVSQCQTCAMLDCK